MVNYTGLWSNPKSFLKIFCNSNAPAKKNKSVFIKNVNACLRTYLRKDYKDYFIKNGFIITHNPAKADYLLLVTCGYIIPRMKEVVYYVKYLKDLKKAGALIIVLGCLPKIDSTVLSKEKEVIQVKEDSELDNLFYSYKRIGSVRNKNVFGVTDYHKAVKPPFFNLFKNKFNLIDNIHSRMVHFLNKIEGDECLGWFHIITNVGCSYNCTYCVIKDAIGKPSSKPVGNILEEFKRGLSLNFLKFYLSSDNLGLYSDKNHNLIDILTAINRIDGEFIIKLRNLHPSWLIANIGDFETVLAKRKIRAISVSVQSGSNKILKKMGRHYKSEDLKACFKRLNSKFPFLSLHTEFIVGFPSENEKDFRDSINFLEGVSIDPRSPSAVFEYCDMNNAPASNYKNKIGPEIKRRRQKILSRKMKLNSFYRGYNFLKRTLLEKK